MKLNISQKKKIVTRITAIVTGITLMGFSAYAAETGNFKKPSLKGYTYQMQWLSDWDKNGINETRTKLYRNSAGNENAKLFKKGTNKIWGYLLDTYGDDDSDITKNYGPNSKFRVLNY